MALAWSSDDFYDLMEDFEDQPGQEPMVVGVSLKLVPFFNTDPSELAPFADEVYSNLIVREQLSIMSAFRKDLFVSITLPVLGLGVLMFGAIGGSFLYTNSSFLRLDDHSRALQVSLSEVTKAQAVSAEQTSAMVKAQEATNSKLDKVIDQLGSVSSGLEVLKSQRSNPPS
uniref:Methyl-accepting chemotaxis protein n=1 Tax=Pseudomonas phage Aurca01 TaxID=3138527 RepID=A0AAU6W4I5_9VIRU